MLNDNQVSRRVFSVDETAKILGSSRSVIYRMLREGRLKAVTIGSRKRIPEYEIARVTGSIPDSSPERGLK